MSALGQCAKDKIMNKGDMILDDQEFSSLLRKAYKNYSGDILDIKGTRR